MPLHLSPQVRDEVLSLHAEQQSQEEGGSCLDADGNGQDGEEPKRRSTRPCPITSSMRYLLEAGRTSPLSRLAKMRKIPKR